MLHTLLRGHPLDELPSYSPKERKKLTCPLLDEVEPPKNWAVALYDGLDVIDVFGPIDVLYILSLSQQLNLYFLADTMAPVWMRPPLPELNKAGSNFTASFNPTHTFDNPPNDIEILLVPGGLGMRRGNSSEPVVDFVRKTYPKVKYLLTTCTGAGVAARAGVLDGKRATTNKAAWNEIVKMGPNVKWVSPARWTVDGNIWTSSGVSLVASLFLWPRVLGPSGGGSDRQLQLADCLFCVCR